MPDKSPADESARETIDRLIRERGAISLADYFAIANTAYYGSRDPLGADGDFITAPEISQMFGEMIGLWVADLWQRTAKPDFAYVELGPGRGTLASDVLRAASRFGCTPPVHFVETSAPLKAAQAQHHPDAVWYDDISSLPDDRPLVVIANEFFDALPVRQFHLTDDGWRERLVAHTEQGHYRLIDGDEDAAHQLPEPLRHAPPDSLFETSDASVEIVRTFAEAFERNGGAMLAIDYGHTRPGYGDTVQAVSGHEAVDILGEPGSIDLTAHVDFSALGRAAMAAGAHVPPVVTQGQFLMSLGIEQRAKRLSASDPTKSEDIEQALDRLTSPHRMGELFKAMAIKASHWPDPAGFTPAS